MITQLGTSSCETRYDVDGVKLRLWVATGGTPALAFDDWRFTKRFKNLAKYSNENWINDSPCHYRHQDPYHPQGITFDELPKGEQALYDFIRINLPKKQLAEKRFNELPLHNIESKRVHDKEDHTYVKAKLNLILNGVSPVTFESGAYCGRCDEKIELFDTWWQTTQKLFNPIFDSGHSEWHQLT